uniref:Cyclin-like domain-containing protein n=1 Tax=Strigamia maritima TaxID=126957 RepID=T1IHR0_STRMM
MLAEKNTSNCDEKEDVDKQNNDIKISDQVSINANTKIRFIANKLKLSQTIVDRADDLFQQVHCMKSVLKVRSNNAIASTCLYIACRQEKVARTFTEVSDVSNVSKKKIGRYFKLIMRALKTNINLVSTRDFTVRFCNNLDLSKEMLRVATNIAERAFELGVVSSRSPISVAAAAIYFVSQVSNDVRSRKKVAEVTGVHEQAIEQSFRRMYCRLDEFSEVFPQNFQFCVSEHTINNKQQIF